jgi:hypothetical protein
MNGKNTNTFTQIGVCTPNGQTAPACPAGWESVGFTHSGACTIGSTPGDGPMDIWRSPGYQRVCKRTVPTSGDLAADCCSNLYGIADSVECKTSGWKPYSWDCNTVMKERCNGNIQKDPYRHNWNGMPYGQNIPVDQPCSGKIRLPNREITPGSIGTPTSLNINRCGATIKGDTDQFCINYLRNAPPNNFFNNHDYSDAPHYFPRYSYTTPDFTKTWGYQPMRKPYTEYRFLQYKDHNNYCRQFPDECRQTYINNYHL